MGNYKTRTCLEKYTCASEAKPDVFTYLNPANKTEYEIELLEDDTVVSLTTWVPFAPADPERAERELPSLNESNHFGYLSVAERDGNPVLKLRATLWIGTRMSDKTLHQLFNAASSFLSAVADELSEA